MKKKFAVLFSLLAVAMLCTLCTQSPPTKLIPQTTESDEALELYQKGLDAFNKLYYKKAVGLFDKALELDPDFIWPAFRLVSSNLYFDNIEEGQKYAAMVVNSQAKLSKGEEIIRSIATSLLEDPGFDFSELAGQLIELHPDDIESYFTQIVAYALQKNDKGVIEASLAAIENVEVDPGVYNTLGYSYMNLDQMENAELYFDKYIEVAPDEANPFDSKGDFYMKVKDYEKALKYYKIACEKDTTWNKSKALKAKQLMEEARELKESKESEL